MVPKELAVTLAEILSLPSNGIKLACDSPSKHDYKTRGLRYLLLFQQWFVGVNLLKANVQHKFCLLFLSKTMRLAYLLIIL